MSQRFPETSIATDRQREFLRSLTTPDNPQAADPALTMNAAWRLCGMHLPCEDRDAKVLRFFREDPADYTQTAGEDCVAEFLSDPVRAALWADHPIPNEDVAEAIYQGLDSAEAWGFRVYMFQGILADFDVHKAFEFDAECLAHEAIIDGANLRQVRKMVRLAFTARLKELRANHKICGYP